MWRSIDVLASSIADLGADVLGIYGARAVAGSIGSLAVSSRQLQLDEISLGWSTLTGDLSIVLDRQEDKKTFLFLSDGIISLDPGDPDPIPPIPLKTAAFPTGRAEKVTLKSGTAYAVVNIPRWIFKKRLSVLLGSPVDKKLKFVNFPDSEAHNLSVLRDQIFQFPTTPLIIATELLGTRNQSLVNLVVDSFLMLYPNNYTSVLSDTARKIAPRHVKRALDYIHTHPDRHVEPQVLADLSAVSKRTLQYSFLSATGTTISEYQRVLRLRRAHEMVISTPEVPLKVIAGMWGFGSQTAFGQSFKKAFGISPSEARRNKEGLFSGMPKTNPAE